MLTRSNLITVPLTLAFYLTPVAAAQVQSDSWADVFTHGFHSLAELDRVDQWMTLDSAPSVLGPIYGRCDVGAPDSIVLVAQPEYSSGVGGWSWPPSFIAADLDKDRWGRMQRVLAPLKPDTLIVRLARTICGTDGALHAFITEYAGRYLQMDVPSQGQMGFVWFFVHDRDGSFSELRWSPVLEHVESTTAARVRWTTKGWRKRAIDAILSGRIYVGMNSGMVQEAWGKPRDVNTTTTATTRHEQWVYGSGQYVYFENGTVVSIQQ